MFAVMCDFNAVEVYIMIEPYDNVKELIDIIFYST
jgi:hypothetical protein